MNDSSAYTALFVANILPNVPISLGRDKDFQNVGDKTRILGGSWDFLVLQDEWISPPHGLPKC